MAQILFQGKNKENRSIDLEGSECINMIPVLNPNGSRAQKAYFMRPGRLELGTGSGTAIKGGAVSKDGTEGYIVEDTTFYTVDTSGTRTSRGTVAAGDYTNRIAIGFDNIFLTNGTNAYTYVPSTTAFTTVTDGDFPGADTVTYLDGYFVISQTNARTFYISAIDDGLTWDALDFASKESQPDNIRSVIANDRNLYLLGERTIEVWYNSGDTFPFDRREYLEWGCAAKFSPSKLEGSVYFLGQTEWGSTRILKLTNYQVQPISGPIDSLLEQYSTINDARGFSLMQDGQNYYIIEFPTQDITWVYCVEADEWVEWRDSDDNRFKINTYMRLGTKNIIADDSANKLYELDLDHLDDDGVDFNWEIVTPTYYADNKRIHVSRVQADIEAGIGTGGGNNPSITLAISRDGARTFATGKAKTAGEQNDFDNRVYWTRLGTGRYITYKFTGSSSNAWRLLSLSHEAWVGGT